ASRRDDHNGRFQLPDERPYRNLIIKNLCGFRDKIGPLHHPIPKPANLPDFLAVARTRAPPYASVRGLDTGGLLVYPVTVNRRSRGSGQAVGGGIRRDEGS